MSLIRGAAPILATFVVTLVLTLTVFRFVDMRSDMADFLPAAHTDAGRLMLRELRAGAPTSLLLVGIEGADPRDLARISRAMATTLAGSGQFALVANGETGFDAEAERLLFTNRYLLSPAVTEASFTLLALQQSLSRLLDGLSSSAGMLVQLYGFADPTGAFLSVVQRWTEGRAIRSIDGVWFSPDGARALMLVRTRAAGLDLIAQDQADTAVRAAFAAASPEPARLLLSGPAIFARDAERGVRHDVRLLSVASVVLVAGLLLWRFRSPLVLLVIAVPIMLAVAAAALTVQLVFGFVQGMAFGFGMTMLGVTVDYPVLLIGHRKRGEAASGTFRRIGATFNLAVASASLGLVGMLGATLPGFVQVGTFAVVGLLVAAAATRWLLPPLIVAADLAPVPAGSAARLMRVERLRHGRAWGLVPVAVAVLVLLLHPPTVERDLNNLSPVPAEARALDQELRRQLGAPEVGQIAIVRGASVEEVLQRQERLLPLLDRLTADKVIDGAELAARYLPSLARQRERQAALPDAETLGQRLAEALADLPFRPEAFTSFRQDAEAARTRAPLTPADLTSPILAARVQPLLFQRDGAWYGMILPRGVNDAGRLSAAIGAAPDVIYVDIGRELNAMLTDGTTSAWTWLSWSAAATMLALIAGLRDIRRTVRVIGTLVAAGLVTIAVLSLTGVRLSLIHIVALQFAAGVGLDYALFFARIQVDEEERARTLRTLVTCNAMTLMTFGLLVFCQTSLLRTIGLPVAIGTFSALCFGFLFAGPRPPAHGTSEAAPVAD